MFVLYQAETVFQVNDRGMAIAIAMDRANGHSCYQIARYHDMQPKRVRWYLKKLGICSKDAKSQNVTHHIVVKLSRRQIYDLMSKYCESLDITIGMPYPEWENLLPLSVITNAEIMFTARHLVKIISIATDYAMGHNCRQIAKHFGMTNERIRQILKRLGYDAKDRLLHARALINKQITQDIKARKAKKIMDKYGCSIDEWLSTKSEYAGHHTLLYRYKNIKYKCKYSNVAFELTLPEWIRIWRESGKIGQMGSHKGQYGLFRIDPSRGYVHGNLMVTEPSAIRRWPQWRAVRIKAAI